MMEPVHVAHLVLLAMWAGLVVGETVLEFHAHDEAALRVSARVHYWIDVLAELPLLAGILATGVMLTYRAWPLSTLHVLKITAGLVAISANLVCVVVVFRRHRGVADVPGLLRLRRRVAATAVVGVPFAVFALIVGLAYFRR